MFRTTHNQIAGLAALALVAAPSISRGQKTGEKDGRLEAEIAAAVSQSIRFSGTTATVPTSASKGLDRVGGLMKTFDGLTIRLDTSVPADSAGKELATRRAETVKRQIVSSGGENDRIRVVLVTSTACPAGGSACPPPSGTVRVAADKINVVVAKP